MMFSFFISALGFSFVIRISDHLIARNLFSKSEMTKIGTAYFASSIALAILLPRSQIMLWLSMFAPLMLMCLMLCALVQKRVLRFRANVQDALTLTLLKMKSGRSFRQSFAEVIAESDARLRVQLSEINGVVAFSQQKETLKSDPFIAQLIDVLMRADHSPHSALRRLTVYRDKIRMEDDFRRRSGQILSRIRAQSLVMTGLYFAVLVFVVIKFGWKTNANIIVISLVLFALGFIWIWWGGRKLKWKV